MPLQGRQRGFLLPRLGRCAPYLQRFIVRPFVIDRRGGELDETELQHRSQRQRFRPDLFPSQGQDPALQRLDGNTVCIDADPRVLFRDLRAAQDDRARVRRSDRVALPGLQRKARACLRPMQHAQFNGVGKPHVLATHVEILAKGWMLISCVSSW
ncbi:hypothetical protein J2W96_002676 [Variovorax guangxiensis]|nr:hypothetical protein [Variovorax guangxiensis]MDR6856359.1 hypothetical protein [Variovorax guangxiensis]